MPPCSTNCEDIFLFSDMFNKAVLHFLLMRTCCMSSSSSSSSSKDGPSSPEKNFFFFVVGEGLRGLHHLRFPKTSGHVHQ